MPEQIHDIASWLLGPLYFLVLPEKRIFWLSLICTWLIAVVFLYRKKVSFKFMLKIIDPRALFNTPSKRFDIKVMFFNFWLKKILGLLAISSSLVLSAHFASNLDQWFPNPITRSWPGWYATLSFTICAFLVEDFTRFWLHRQLHRRSYLWAFHRTHHSADSLTPLSLYRTHPVESLLSWLRHTLSFTLCAGLFLYLFKDKFNSWTILGVGGIGFLFNISFANLRHSHLFIGFGRWERFFLSPAQHQLHHSRDPNLCHQNFGVFLSIWDRLYHCLCYSEGQQPGEFGVSKNENHSFRQQIVRPFGHVLRQILLKLN